MNISAWSIKNPVPAILLFFFLTILGLFGFSRLGVQDIPDMDLPTINITASLEGAAPEQLETEVARKIEDKLTSLSKLDHITTTITDGQVSIAVSFELEKNSQEALSEVRNAVDSAKADLPSSMSDPTVSKDNAASSALVTYSIESNHYDDKDLSWFVDNDVTKALMSVQGVNTVTRVGGVDREVQIELNPTLMSGLGITPSNVSSQLKSMQQDASGGQGRIGGEHQSVRTLANVNSVADLGAFSIPVSDGRYVHLNEIAKIQDTYADVTSRAYRDGKPIMGFQIKRSKGYSDVAVTNAIRAAMQKFQQQHPEVKIVEASNTVDPIEDNYHGSMDMLYEGAFLAIVIVWLFLKNWRTTLISAVALPLSIIPAFGVMYLLDYSLNIITLLALSLVVGILVDDAIVEVENIERHLKNGKTPYEAALEATDEIGLAVVATTLTLIAIFLPTAFMSGITGLFFKQFGITASVSIFASLLVARLLTPMMAAYLLKPHSGEVQDDHADGWIMSSYKKLVDWTLEHRKITMFMASGFFLLTVFIGLQNSVSFLPAQDKSQSKVKLELQAGSNLAETNAVALQAEQLIRQLPEVKHVFSVVGNSDDVTQANLTVDLLPRSERKPKQVQVEQEIREKLKNLAGVRVTVGGGNNGEKLELTLASDNPDLLLQTANSAENQLRTLKGIGNITSDAAIEQPEIQIHPNMAQAASFGVTSEALADAIRYATYGGYSSDLPKLNFSQRQVAIRVRMNPELRQNLDAISNIKVAATDGTVTLGSVAKIELGSGPSQINRLDRLRNITMSVELNGRPTGEVQAEAMKLPAFKNLPKGVKMIQQGESQRMGEMLQGFGLAMFVGIVCVYAVLVLLFHDFLQPVTILSALPLALGGAFVSLYICGLPYSMSVVIGILMLMGIVTKNSILLVDYAILARREKNCTRLEAVMDACSKRARPIIMTTLAMGMGMMPNALGLGAEPSMRQPTAIVVIGGLLTSTVLSLVVVPVVFTYVDDLLLWFKKHSAQ
ncbi:efflux RND transporter permease subunit [Acinetobacter sp. MB5]|uniref:efflux RND transporter permease subunit n=1 Tax=Acinetobacter sp. MB5 TaxID=2069438 RepID=UPI000DCFDC48|nr:efflux RND transporter permease subunit [Acinetobacter sp. MB5]